MEGYADLTLSYYSLVATVCLWRYLGSGKNVYLSLCGILVAMGCFTKNEGLFFFLALLAALYLFILFEKKRALPAFVYFLLPFLVVAGPWLFFKFSSGLGFGHSGAESALKWLSDPRFGQGAQNRVHWEIFGAAFNELFFKANFNLIIPFWLFVSVVGVRTIIRTNIKYLFVVMLAVMAMFIFVYLTLEVTTVTKGTGIHRNTLTYVPIIFFTSAVLVGRIWPPSAKGFAEG
jgi:4-amino-4-deoxy-L-arabinose transferase-like glycosyltransferase